MTDSNFREMGILFFDGMKVGFLYDDLPRSIDESGNQNSKLILSTSYNVIPLKEQCKCLYICMKKELLMWQ
jgi:hypothetical protein